MSRSVPEWIGKTDDTPVPDRVKLRVFEKFEGICPKCTRELEPGAWECDHVIPLILGGANRETNLQPLCADPCHSSKTALDVKLKAKVERVRRHRAGIRKRSRFPGSRDSKFKRKLNGEVVLR
jgi:5-methylcytosine-specific restriction protein A